MYETPSSLQQQQVLQAKASPQSPQQKFYFATFLSQSGEQALSADAAQPAGADAPSSASAGIMPGTSQTNDPRVTVRPQEYIQSPDDIRANGLALIAQYASEQQDNMSVNREYDQMSDDIDLSAESDGQAPFVDPQNAASAGMTPTMYTPSAMPPQSNDVPSGAAPHGSARRPEDVDDYDRPEGKDPQHATARMANPEGMRPKPGALPAATAKFAEANQCEGLYDDVENEHGRATDTAAASAGRGVVHDYDNHVIAATAGPVSQMRKLKTRAAPSETPSAAVPAATEPTAPVPPPVATETAGTPTTPASAVHQFHVRYQPDGKGGVCKSRVVPTSAASLRNGIALIGAHCIELVDAETRVPVRKWQKSHIRQYGFDKLAFKFEAGRRCPSGEGWFVFVTFQGETIRDLLDRRRAPDAGVALASQEMPAESGKGVMTSTPLVRSATVMQPPAARQPHSQAQSVARAASLSRTDIGNRPSNLSTAKQSAGKPHASATSQAPHNAAVLQRPPAGGGAGRGAAMTAVEARPVPHQSVISSGSDEYLDLNAHHAKPAQVPSGRPAK